MVGGAGGNWKRPVNRMYSYNYQVAGGALEPSWLVIQQFYVVL